MRELDSLIERFVNGRLSRRGLVKSAAALGVGGAALQALQRSHVVMAQPADNSVRWVSPRGTIDVLDDYAYWVAVKFGYFGDISTTLEPGPIEATAGTKAVDTGQADVAYPSPGVYSLMIEQGSPLISVFEMGAYDVFDFAFPKGQAPASVKDLEGKTVALGSAGWQGICNPEIAQAGGDPTKVEYVDAGPQWGQTLAQGQADSALSWAGLRAQWAAIGLDFDYILGKDWSKFPANSFVIRRSDFEDAALADIYGRYFRGWAQGLEFGYYNPVAATQITFEALPALNEVFEDKQIAVESMWQLADVFRGDWATREGWGWHSEESWNLFLKTTFDIGQLTKELTATDVLTNDWVAAANDFDHEAVKAQALEFELSEDFASLTQPEGAGALRARAPRAAAVVARHTEAAALNTVTFRPTNERKEEHFASFDAGERRDSRAAITRGNRNVLESAPSSQGRPRSNREQTSRGVRGASGSMHRMDVSIERFVNGRLSRRGLVKSAAALGLSGAALQALQRSHVVMAQPADNSVRWVSPRGTIDVLDDYAYHVAAKMGYFGDISTTLEPGPVEATAGTKAVDSGQSDVAYPSPGVFSLMIEQDSPLISVFGMGALDVFDFAFPKGQAPASVKDLEGKTVSLISAGAQSVCDPEVAQAGGDPSLVDYVDAGPQWGQALAQGQVDAALCWEGLRAQWTAIGLDFDYILGKDWSKFPANSFVIRRSDFEDSVLADVYGRYFRGWAMGLEFGYYNPVAATQITFEALPVLNEVFEDKQIAVESMWQLAQIFRGDWAAREGWGWHSEEDWNLFLKTAFDIGQLSEELTAADVLSNAWVATANDFDHEAVAADAAGFELGEDFASLTQPEGAGA